MIAKYIFWSIRVPNWDKNWKSVFTSVVLQVKKLKMETNDSYVAAGFLCRCSFLPKQNHHLKM